MTGYGTRYSNAKIAEMWQIAKDDVVYLPIHHQVLNWAMDSDDQVKVMYFTLG